MAFRSRRLRVQLPCSAESSLVDVVAAREGRECPADLVSVSAAPCNWVFASSPPCRDVTCVDMVACDPPAVSEAPCRPAAVSGEPPQECPAGFATPGPECPSGVSACPGGGISEEPPPPTDCFPTLCPDLFHTAPCREPSCDFFSHDIIVRQDAPGDTGAILVDPRALPVLRERLSQRLRQIEAVDQEKEHLRARIEEIDAAAGELRRRGDLDG
jgi:hypothetical protein